MGSCPNTASEPSCRAHDTLHEFYDDLEELYGNLFPRIAPIITALQNRRMGQFATSLKEQFQNFPARPFADFLQSDEDLDFFESKGRR